MALPSGVNGKTLTFGTTTGFDGTPVPEGSRVTITTSKNVKHLITGRQLVAGSIVRKYIGGIATFDELVPNDAAGLDRYDWTYFVRFEIAGAQENPEPFSFVLFDDDPQTIDGDLLSPVPSSIGTPVSVNALRLPPGGTVGQALVFTEDFGVAWASLQPAGDYATNTALTSGLATKVNSSTYTAGLATKLDASGLDAAAAPLVADSASQTGVALRVALGLPAASTVTASGALVEGRHNSVDATGAAATMTLPTGKSGGTLLSVEKIDATANIVTITGSIRGSSSSINLAWPHETLLFSADASGSWWPVAGHKTKASLDAAYGGASLTTDVFRTGREYDGPALPNNAPLVQKIVKSDTYPSSTNLPLSYKEWQHDGSQGYILHLTQGPNMAANGPALIGLGGDNNGVCLFVNNKKTGVGIKVTQNDTITSASAFGLMVNASSTVAPGAWFGQGVSGAKPAAVFAANVTGAASQRLVEFRTTVSTASDTLAGYVASDTGNLVWQTQASFQPKDVATVPVTVVGLTSQTADLINFNASGSGTVAKVEKDGTVTSSVRHRVQGAGGQFDLYDTAGTVNSRRFQIKQTAGYLAFSARNDANAAGGVGDMLLVGHATGNLGVAGTASFGGGSKVVGIPDAATVPTTNATAGGVLYSEGGSLKWRGSAGTVTVLAPA